MPVVHAFDPPERFVAGTVGTLGVAFLAPVVVAFALRFGPAEYFSLMVLAFITVSAVLGSSAVRGLTSLFLGFFVVRLFLTVRNTVDDVYSIMQKKRNRTTTAKNEEEEEEEEEGKANYVFLRWNRIEGRMLTSSY